MCKDLIAGCLQEICRQIDANIDFAECSEEKKKLILAPEFKEKLNQAKALISQALLSISAK